MNPGGCGLRVHFVYPLIHAITIQLLTMGVNVTPTKKARIWSWVKYDNMKPQDMAARLGISKKSTKDWSIKLLADPLQPLNLYKG
jgi:hypothetical protein